MLGGSFWIAMLRHMMGAALMMGVFFLLDRPRFSIKRTAVYYCAFGMLAAAAFGVWYLADVQIFIRLSGFMAIFVVGIFCIAMSADFVYLSVYKLTLGFYLLSVMVFLGIDGSRLWFGGSLWADIALRAATGTVMLLFIIKSVRPRFQSGREYLSAVMDLPSAITLVVMLMIAGVGAYWPDDHALSVNRVVRIAVMLAMTGIIQWMTFRTYLYRGKEYCCRMEKELMELNELLLERQLRQMQVSGANVAHAQQICDNVTVSNILSTYIAYADEEKIGIKVQADIDAQIQVREFDIAAILVSIFENAIYECRNSYGKKRQINVVLLQNKNKVVLMCQNTCAPKREQEEYPAYWKEKAECIRKLVRYYNGEVEFLVEDNVRVSKVLLDVSMQGRR